MNKESLAEQQYVPSPEEQVILRAEAHAFSMYNDKEKPTEWLAAHNGFLAGYAAALDPERRMRMPHLRGLINAYLGEQISISKFLEEINNHFLTPQTHKK